jgi:hypothetical protein
MPDELPAPAAPPAGLCAVCVHARRIESRRGSVFLMCERSRTDARFPKYPRLPVLRCDGFQLRTPDASEPIPAEES